MARISNKQVYRVVEPTSSDYLIGTDAEDFNKTKTFTIQGIADFVGQNVTIGVGSLNTLTGPISLIGGDGLTVTDDGADTITISMDRPDYIESLNGLIGDVDIVGSTNITITNNGSDTITVDTQNLAKTNEANTFVSNQTMTRDLSVGGSVFNVDYSAGRVGVNRLTPSTALDILGGTIIEGNTGDVLTLKSPSLVGQNYILFKNSSDSDKGWVGYRGASDILQIDNLISDIELSSLTGAVKLSLGASVKLQTKATGVDVNGEVSADSHVTNGGTSSQFVKGDGSLDSTNYSGDIAAEQAARIAADNILQGNIDDEESARIAADNTLQNNIDAEESARIAADNTLQDNIDSEATTRANADTTLQDNIDSEATTRANADNTLQDNIDAEEAARISADTTLQDNIDAEETTRANADTALQNQITSNDTDISALQAADTTLQNNIDAEESARIAADTTLQDNIDSEAVARANADTALQGNINAEAATRLANDNTLQSNIDAEESARIAADSSLQGQITNNDTDISNLDTRLTTAEGDITSEESARIAADNTLQDNIDDEESARIAADTALDNAKQDISEKNQANGYAPLDSGAKIPIANLPDSVVGQVEYQGTWNASTNTPTLANPPASTTKGHYYVTNVAGTQFGLSFLDGDWIISNGSGWDKVDNTDAVTSVFGRIGPVEANGGDYALYYPPKSRTISAGTGLTGGGDLTENRTISHADTSSQGSVNNSGLTFIQDVTLDGFGHVTSLNSATVTLPTVNDTTITLSAGTGLTGGGNFTTNQSGVETITFNNSDRGSSQNIFKNISVSGQSTIVADSNNDTLTFAAGSNVTLTTNATNDTITIASSFTDTNNFVDSVAFNTGNGILTLGRSGLSDLTVDLDGRYLQSSDLGNYVTLNTDQTITAEKTFNNSGSDSNIIVNHTSGSGIALDITKSGDGEGLRINKTSGSGNAVTVTGDAQINGDIYIDENLYHNGDTNTRLRFDNDRLRVDVGGDTNIDITPNEFDLRTSGANRITLTDSLTSILTDTEITGALEVGVATITNNSPSLLFNETDVTPQWRLRAAGGTLRVQYSSDGSSSYDNKVDFGANILGVNYDTEITGDLIVDTDTLFVDASANRVGIGTDSPENLLHVQQGTLYDGIHTSAGIRIKSDGASGIGNYHGTIALSRGTGSVAISAVQEATDSDVLGIAFFTHPSTAGGDAAVEQMRIDQNGNVGIGTDSPSQKLEIRENAGQGTTPPTLRITNSGTYGSTGTLNVPHGAIEFYQEENSGNYPAVSAAIKSINENVYGISHGLAFYTNPNNTEPTERMRIDSSGNVGIGTDNPTRRLHVFDTSGGNVAEFSNNVDADLNINLTSGVTLLTPSTGILAFGTSNTERMRIDSSGNVGIGTTSPSAKLQIGSNVAISSEMLDVRGNGVSQYIASFEQDNTSGYGVLIDTDGTLTSQPALKIKNSSSELFYVGSSGNVGIGTDNPASSAVSSGAVIVDLKGNAINRGGVVNFRTSDSSKIAWVGLDGGLAKFGTETSNDTVFYTANVERMRIDSAGNVSIKAPLASGGGVLNLENTSTAVNGQDWGSLNFISNDSSSGASGIRASLVGTSTSFNGDGNLVFSTAPSNGTNTERMRIDSSGNVSMTNNLTVSGTISGNGSGLTSVNATTFGGDAPTTFARTNVTNSFTANQIFEANIQFLGSNRDITNLNDLDMSGNLTADGNLITSGGYLQTGSPAASTRKSMKFGSYTADTSLDVIGYIDIEHGGTARKVAILGIAPT